MLTIQRRVSARLLKIVKEKLEEDTINVSKFMASNGLVANPNKTTIMFLNLKQDVNERIKINVGKSKIQQAKHAKLLGIYIDDDQTWKTQIEGKGVILSSLNCRLFLVKRLNKCVKK